MKVVEAKVKERKWKVIKDTKKGTFVKKFGRARKESNDKKISIKGNNKRRKTWSMGVIEKNYLSRKEKMCKGVS